MEAELRARLTKPQVGCTQAHVDLFVANEVYSVADVQGMDDGELDGSRRLVSSSAHVVVSLQSLVPSPHQLLGVQLRQASAVPAVKGLRR